MGRISSMIKRLPEARWGSATRSLRQFLRRSYGAPELSDLPCAVCGAPAEAWSYRTYSESGTLVVDGAAVCQLHQLEAIRKAG